VKILVSGADGQLAQALKNVWKYGDLMLPAESELNLTNRDSILATIRQYEPDVFINCAAYTNVDGAESDSDMAFLVNGTAVQWVAEGCNEVNALLVQISTDYVFDGLARTPRAEGDPTSPCNVYGHSKLEGERATTTATDHLLFRTAWLYDAWGKNFFTTMLRLANQDKPLKIVNDQFGSPTSCSALARQIQFAVENEWRGLFNATCLGETTWYKFADTIFNSLEHRPEYAPCGTSDYPTQARRPAYSVLDNSKRLSLGTDLMGTWEEALGEVLSVSSSQFFATR